jgi:hypothetical protein
MCSPVEITHTVDWLWAGAGGAVVGGVLGALAGSAVPLWWAWHARQVERRGEIIAMRDEMQHALTAMTALRTKPKILAPLYHLPLTTFERGLPKLIGEGKLTEAEISALVEYEMRAQELNRGLDLAVKASAVDLGLPGNFATLEGLHGRNADKVRHILDEKQPRLGETTVFEAAEAGLTRLSRKKRVT